MLLKTKSITPGQRHLTKLDNSNLNKKKIIKINNRGKLNSGGRNHSGKITHFRKGGGHKKLYRKIDFYRTNLNGIVVSIEYDPNRTANIALIFDPTQNNFTYIICPLGLKKGDFIKSGNSENKIGHSDFLSKLPLGSFIHNVSTLPGNKSQIARAAGTYAQLIEKTEKYAKVKLKSGEQRFIPLQAKATLGIVSNKAKNLINLGKAGRSRWLNKRPTVRGVAMNPVDHPHGGGEGKTSGGRPSVTPWGKPAKGRKTTKSTNKLILIKRK